MDMSCYLMPSMPSMSATAPYMKLAYMPTRSPAYVLGYANTSQPGLTPGTVAGTTNATATSTTTNTTYQPTQYTGLTLPQLNTSQNGTALSNGLTSGLTSGINSVLTNISNGALTNSAYRSGLTNGTVHPSVGSIPSTHTTQTLSSLQVQLYQNALTAAAVARLGTKTVGYHRTLKRKAEDGGDDGTTPGGDSASSRFTLYQMYCKCCRVTLNAQAQAKQHYEGKSHAKKLRLWSDGEEEEDKDGEKKDKTSEEKAEEDTKPKVEILPEVYCKTCGVSFNSSKQAQQHYKGKNHNKKVRSDGRSPRERYHYRDIDKYGKFACPVCDIRLTSQEQLEGHMRGARHHIMATAGGNGLVFKPAYYSKVTGVPGYMQPLTGLMAPAALTTPYLPSATATPYLSSLSSMSSMPSMPSATPTISTQHMNYALYRTPSGQFYCPTCNLTLQSELHFTQHLASKGHKHGGVNGLLTTSIDKLSPISSLSSTNSALLSDS